MSEVWAIQGKVYDHMDNLKKQIFLHYLVTVKSSLESANGHVFWSYPGYPCNKCDKLAGDWEMVAHIPKE